jgi:hypothetical protein
MVDFLWGLIDIFLRLILFLYRDNEYSWILYKVEVRILKFTFIHLQLNVDCNLIYLNLYKRSTFENEIYSIFSLYNFV